MKIIKTLGGCPLSIHADLTVWNSISNRIHDVLVEAGLEYLPDHSTLLSFSTVTAPTAAVPGQDFSPGFRVYKWEASNLPTLYIQVEFGWGHEQGYSSGISLRWIVHNTRVIVSSGLQATGVVLPGNINAQISAPANNSTTNTTAPDAAASGSIGALFPNNSYVVRDDDAGFLFIAVGAGGRGKIAAYEATQNSSLVFFIQHELTPGGYPLSSSNSRYTWVGPNHTAAGSSYENTAVTQITSSIDTNVAPVISSNAQGRMFPGVSLTYPLDIAKSVVYPFFVLNSDRMPSPVPSVCVYSRTNAPAGTIMEVETAPGVTNDYHLLPNIGIIPFTNDGNATYSFAVRV